MSDSQIHSDHGQTDPKALAPGTRALALIVATAFFMENLDLTVIATALPQMAEAFATTPVALSLGLTSYILALAIVLPASGWIADRWGARRVFMLAILGFTLASILCSLSTSLPQFVCARSLQGLSGAMMSPVGRLVFLRLTDKKDLVRGMNFITAPGLIGTLIGPPIGGLIATYADWRWIFLLNLPIGLIGLILVRRHRPLHSEELWTFIGVLVWIAGDVVIAGVIPEQNASLRWGARALLFLILTSDYVALRGRPAAIIVEETARR